MRGSRPEPAFRLPSDSSSSSAPSAKFEALHTTARNGNYPYGSDNDNSNNNNSNDNNNDDEDDYDDDDVPLPFPTALSRNDFLAPDFNAAAYLSSLFPGSSDDTAQGGLGLGLGTRHQTLEDLRTELRERSSAISAELLELVNANYTAFLSLGDELKGGEERVEDVRVGLLGFRRQVEEVQGRVKGRKEDVQRVGAELRGVRREVELGRRMLELDDRLEALAGRLEQNGAEDRSDDGEDDEEEDGQDDQEHKASFTGRSPALLLELARELGVIHRLADAVGRETPYVKKAEERIIRCRNTLLLDLADSLRQARKTGEKGSNRVLTLLSVYRLLGAHAESVKILKEK
ncbi:oligomeric golgi complex component, COG2-domain-containing protein [Coniella lustricola]|uniref:Conserved oligomeric Golgi complex subunit 2 n=1 Tax=Coniella lustricola TaxID=2025994 RepID=A0A2T3A2P0_9PEZI|nr:oligomeric golgi complex component, COG2-domain-containing protein [Coniella lustricola]